MSNALYPGPVAPMFCRSASPAPTLTELHDSTPLFCVSVDPSHRADAATGACVVCGGLATDLPSPELLVACGASLAEVVAYLDTLDAETLAADVTVEPSALPHAALSADVQTAWHVGVPRDLALTAAPRRNFL